MIEDKDLDIQEETPPPESVIPAEAGTDPTEPASRYPFHNTEWRSEDCKLRNEGLPEEERDWFADARPQPARTSNQIMEKFFNWCRAHSLWILAFGTGCGAIELRPLVTSRYDISRLGMQMRPTPRQASVFVIGGYVSIKTLKRIVRSYEQMQGPKFVVAVCSCAINGGMYWDSYNTIKRIDEYIPVDVYVTGCMPRPEAVMAGFTKLKELIMAGKAEGQNLYAEKFDWYKANQKQVIKDWNMPDYNW
ncbi:MAG TPA: NADH-quinone oxidoreductase subunit NuoB [Candidatus Cloacimonadota bacterium]|nr:NADH-quinone oxidoreductase subunit NuoB [Candidatus Cloacimonadota bacterium]HOH79242.1 NADH-quinone oxidoreductase subunit NuoB [Candidatus Cloacimonadota bacterium]